MKHDLIERLVDCFGYIGPTSASIPAKFSHRVRPDFIHSSISPCILKPGETLEPRDLDALKSGIFRDYAGPAQNLRPFFSLVGATPRNAAAAELAKAAGWVESYPRDAEPSLRSRRAHG